MKKIPKQAYTAEFRELALKCVTDGQGIVAAAKALGLNEQTLRNWVKAGFAGWRNVVSCGRTASGTGIQVSR